MSDEQLILIAGIARSAPTENGEHILLDFTLQDGSVLHLVVPHERAIDLIAHSAMASGGAASIRERDPGQRYFYPADRFEIGRPLANGKVPIHFGLPGGMELSFLVDPVEAHRFWESLGSALGVDVPTPPPGSRLN